MENKFLVLLVGEDFYQTFDTRKEAEDYAKKQIGMKVMICEILKQIDNVEYPTLREYINEKSCGAYHHFIFNVYNCSIDVIGVNDFERIYKKDILDTFCVIKDETKSNGNDCTNYDCKHFLELKEKEKENN